MENNTATVRVFNIKTKNGAKAPESVELDFIDFSSDVNTQITADLEEFHDIVAKSFEWEIVTPNVEEQEKLNGIREVLARYFEKHSNGRKSKTYCSWFSAQDAIDEIADLVGEY